MTNPSEYGLEHSEFRPNQEEMIKWANDGKSFLKIVEAPTGSGKTTVPRSLAQNNRTIALVRTKALQEANYEREYNFIPLYGKGNYPCSYEKAKPGAMADQCAFSDNSMTNCPQYSLCQYASQRELAKASNMTTLNYAYWLHVYSSWPAPLWLVCDEAHELSSIVLEWAGCTVTEKDRQEWDLPPFPILRSGGSTSILTVAVPVEEKASGWLSRVRDKLKEQYDYHNARKSDEESRKRARKAELFGKKIRATMDALESAQTDWFIRSGPNVLPFNKESGWGFVARPLTARHHFKNYFCNPDWNLLLMSATIGSIEAFSQELGLTDYDFHSVPSNWAPETRPVHALDVPRLGQKSKAEDWSKQAEEIAKLIKNCPSDWNGIIHVTSIEESKRLAERLGKAGLASRVYIAKRASTNEMVRDWRARMKTHPGSILISWAMWEGYNGLDEKINICAKTPYPFLGDPFEIERRNYNGTFYLQRTAWQLEQGLGRTRRGRPEDYDTPQERRGVVAIADGGWKWLRKYFSPSFMQSVVTP